MWDANSGYYGYSMSNNAVEAYEDGEKPLSRWTKKDIISAIAEIDPVKAELFKKVNLPVLKEKALSYSSWHHTSNRFNITDFYSIDEDFIEKITKDEIIKLSNVKKEPVIADIYKGTLYYLEWSGTRKHPKATEVCLENVNIEERGCFYYVTNDSGDFLIKKKIGSNGTYVINYREEEEKRKRKEERQLRIKELSSKAALEFYNEIKDGCSYSMSNHIYRKNRKPSPDDYELGLDKFFNVGEHRLFQEYDTGILHLETWDGKNWIGED